MYRKLVSIRSSNAEHEFHVLTYAPLIRWPEPKSELKASLAICQKWPVSLQMQYVSSAELRVLRTIKLLILEEHGQFGQKQLYVRQH